MELINPELLRLVPGESIQAMFSKNPDDQGEVGFFVRSVSGINGHNRDPIYKAARRTYQI